MSDIWEEIVADIIVHRNNQNDLNTIVADMQKKYDLSYKPSESKKLKNEILKLTSKFKTKTKEDDLFYDLIILEMEIRPYPKPDGRYVIESKLNILKYGIGKNYYSETDYMRLCSLIKLYIR